MAQNKTKAALARDGQGVADMDEGHALVVGATGSGRTNLLMAMADEAIAAGRSVVYIEGRGDRDITARLFGLADRHGRSEDVMVLDLSARGGHGTSNTINPFAACDATGAVDLITPMLDASEDGRFWRARAVGLARAVLGALVFLRDDGVLDLNADSIRDLLNLNKVIDLTDPDAYPQLPDSVRAPLRKYLGSLPGYLEWKKYKQAQATVDHHGYLVAQMARPLQILGEDYGHVFVPGDGEVHLGEVAGRPSILVVTLPDLTRNAGERAFAGHFAMALVRDLMARRTGAGHEPMRLLVDDLPADALADVEPCLAWGRSAACTVTLALRTLAPATGRDAVGRLVGLVAAQVILRSDEAALRPVAGLLPDAAAEVASLGARIDALGARGAVLAALGRVDELGKVADLQAAAMSALEAAEGRIVRFADLAALETGTGVLVRRGVAVRVRVRDMSEAVGGPFALNPGRVPDSLRQRREVIAQAREEREAVQADLAEREARPVIDLAALETAPASANDVDMVRRAVQACVAVGRSDGR